MKVKRNTTSPSPKAPSGMASHWPVMVVGVAKPRVLSPDPEEMNAWGHVPTARIPQYKKAKAVMAPRKYTTISERMYTGKNHKRTLWVVFASRFLRSLRAAAVYTTRPVNPAKKS